MFIHPGSRVKKIPIQFRFKEFMYFLTQKIVSKPSKIGSGMFIPDPDLVFYLTRPDPGVKKAADPESGCATLPVRPTRYWFLLILLLSLLCSTSLQPFVDLVMIKILF
jgi:hypothetical protein